MGNTTLPLIFETANRKSTTKSFDDDIVTKVRTNTVTTTDEDDDGNHVAREPKSGATTGLGRTAMDHWRHGHQMLRPITIIAVKCPRHHYRCDSVRLCEKRTTDDTSDLRLR